MFPLKFSDWNRTKSILALCLRFIDKVRKRLHNCSTIRDIELIRAEEILIKQAQSIKFEEEISNLSKNLPIPKSSRLKDLDVFIDGQGILRVGGRLKHGNVAYETKHPIVLSKECYVSDLILRYSHDKIAHQGRGMTINAVREQGYWILGLSAKAASLIHQCVICRKLRAVCQEQKMGDCHLIGLKLAHCSHT